MVTNMQILDWVLAKHPGKVDEYSDRYEISHESGRHSTMFKNISRNIIPGLDALGDAYVKYDGMDLFSSAFKLSSMHSSKFIEGVKLIESIHEFAKYVATVKPAFPEQTIPFMYQSGIAIYAVGKYSGRIFEWDIEGLALTTEFENLIDIFEEWSEAVA